MSHALFSPSSAERWLRCGYSIKMAPKFKSVDTAASANGTKHHGIASTHLENGTHSKIPGIQSYLREVRKDVGDDSILLVEHKVVIVPELCTGTLDAAVIRPDWMRNLDLKWGTSAVHATDNPQLKLYLIGLVNEYPTPPDTPVRLSIVQPNGKTGLPVKDWDTTVGHIQKTFMPKVERAMENGLSPNPVAVPGSHCFWCPAKMHCKAYLASKNR